MKKPNFTLWFLRRFSKFREIETACEVWKQSLEISEEQQEELEKESEWTTDLVEVMRRHIKALEDRDKGRLALIAKLETQCRKLREHLAGLLPPQ